MPDFTSSAMLRLLKQPASAMGLLSASTWVVALRVSSGARHRLAHQGEGGRRAAGLVGIGERQLQPRSRPGPGIASRPDSGATCAMTSWAVSAACAASTSATPATAWIRPVFCSWFVPSNHSNPTDP